MCQKEVGAPTAEIATSDLVNWCEQIADGMEYLTMKKVILSYPGQSHVPNNGNDLCTTHYRLSMETLLQEMFLCSAITS